jgi:hypothetical protein
MVYPWFRDPSFLNVFGRCLYWGIRDEVICGQISVLIPHMCGSGITCCGTPVTQNPTGKGSTELATVLAKEDKDADGVSPMPLTSKGTAGCCVVMTKLSSSMCFQSIHFAFVECWQSNTHDESSFMTMGLISCDELIHQIKQIIMGHKMAELGCKEALGCGMFNAWS